MLWEGKDWDMGRWVGATGECNSMAVPAQFGANSGFRMNSGSRFRPNKMMELIRAQEAENDIRKCCGRESQLVDFGHLYVSHYK